MRYQSPVWSCTREQFIEVFERSTTLREIILAFGLRAAGGNYATVMSRIRKEALSVKHLIEGAQKAKGDPYARATPLSQVLVEHSAYSNRRCLKRRLLREKLMLNKCYECNSLPEWRGKPLTLILDHINGVFDDNRLNNLRLLCPNCNSQMETFAGRKNKGQMGSRQLVASLTLNQE